MSTAIGTTVFAINQRNSGVVPFFLRTLVYLITGAVLSYPLTVTEGVIGGAIGAVVGGVLGHILAQSKLRSWVLGVIAVVGLIFGKTLSALWASSTMTKHLLGPAEVLRVEEFLTFLFTIAPLATLLRAFSLRFAPLSLIEVAAIALAFANLVIEHRNGAIHRPYGLADPILARGGDPSSALLGIGALATITFALLLLSEEKLRRSLLQIALFLLFLFSIIKVTHTLGLPPPPPTNDGLRLRDNDQQQNANGGGGEQNQRFDGPDFRDDYTSANRSTPLAIVLLHDDYSPPSGAYYFRQDAFSQFNGNRLVRATLRGADPDIAPGFPVRPLNIEGAPSESILRSSVETTVGMLGEHARPFGLEAPVAFIPATNPNPSRFRRVYRVRSAALTADPVALLGRRAGDPSWSEELWRHYTRAPDDPRYLELAHSIVSSLPSPLREDPYAQALAISNWLSKNGIYSLRSKHAGAPDPTADFLFGDRKGYCIHFAHAAAFLMRSLGLPARVGTGYVYPEAARRGGSAILLSAQNGHAWAELYLQGVGWVVVDVFPEQSLDEGIAPPDEDLQRLLAEMLRGNQILPEDGSEPPVPIEELTRSWLKQGLVVLGFAFLAIVLAMYFIKAWRSLIPLFARPENRARLELRAALDRLAELGIVRPRGLSREAFAVRLAADFPSLLPLCKLAEATHFGNATPPHSDRLRALRTSLSKERSRKAPLWRRILAWLDPLSWLQAR